MSNNNISLKFTKSYGNYNRMNTKSWKLVKYGELRFLLGSQNKWLMANSSSLMIKSISS